MDTLPGSKLRLVLPVAFGLTVAGVTGLAVLVQTVERSDATELLLYALLALTVIGLALVPAWYLNRRFNPPGEVATWSRLFRQAGWVAALVLVMAWMQANRDLNGLLVLLVAVMLFIVEALLLTIGRAGTQPRSGRGESSTRSAQR